MAQININIPDAALPRVINAFAGRFGYDEDNPAHGTKAQFAKAQVVRWIKHTVITYEATTAADEATADAEAQVVIT